ncbi:solute carrier family 35 member SLC35F1/F2/F6 [Scleroderma citrinum]
MMTGSVNVKDSEPSQLGEGQSISIVSGLRPPISLASPSAFARSVCTRFLSVWTPSFVRSMLYGQVLSLALTAVSVLTTELVDRNWVLPSTQVFFPYSLLCIVYTPYTIYRYGFQGWGQLILHDGWKYLILALGDFEAGYLYVKSFGYTDLMSCMLLDAWSIPVCMVVCWFLMHVRYHWTQISGVVICISGLALLVTSDFLTGKNGDASRRGEGDGFMLSAATLFGFVNAAEEFIVRQSPLYEVLGQMGLWGMIASSVQSSIIEREKWKVSTWDGATAGLLMGYTCSTFIIYTLQMLLFRVASSPYFNMSLLTSDFYGLLFGLFLFHYSPYWLYFVAFAIVILGLVGYFWHATPEEQGTTNIKFPRYLSTKSKEGTNCHPKDVV